MIYEGPRTASVKAINNGKEEVILWALGANDFYKYKYEFVTKLKKDTISLMNNIPLFSK